MSNIDCSTCHDIHVNQRGLTKSFNDRCQSCHTQAKHFCKLATASNTFFLQNNCTSCHMPLQASTAIVVQASNQKVAIPSLIVNHRIAIYPDETVKIMKDNFQPEKSVNKH